MEHIVASNIMNHSEDNNILYPLQHGFRRARSCETQLIEFIDDLTSSLDEGQQVDILVMDFAKAFESATVFWCTNFITMVSEERSTAG